MTTVFISLVSIAAIIYLVVCFYMFFFQEKLLFIPTNELSTDPAAFGLEFSEHWIETSDKERLHAWYIPVTNAHYTFLFFHGNTGNISDRMDTIQIFNQLGVSIFMIDYRGYGKSSGTPSEKGTYLDGEASWDYLVNNLNTNPESIIIFGRSLGGGIASELALKYPSVGLILESTFTTLPAVAKDVYPLIPVNLIIRSRYSNIDKIRKVTCPLLVIHSTEDQYIRFHHGQTLFNAYNPNANQNRKYFTSITGTHNNGFFSSVDQYKKGITEFLVMLDSCTEHGLIEKEDPTHEGTINS